jgi:hypothetical protein
MKIPKLLLSPVAAALLVACSSTTFTEYRGQGVRQGKGGTVRTAHGIEFWENGEPDRKYRIVGVIDDSRGSGLISQVKRDGAIAKTAREKGGDAVILLGRDKELSGIAGNGAAYYRRITKSALIQYMGR